VGVGWREGIDSRDPLIFRNKLTLKMNCSIVHILFTRWRETHVSLAPGKWKKGIWKLVIKRSLPLWYVKDFKFQSRFLKGAGCENVNTLRASSPYITSLCSKWQLSLFLVDIRTEVWKDEHCAVSSHYLLPTRREDVASMKGSECTLRAVKLSALSQRTLSLQIKLPTTD
jgi:hypothetical protein